MAVLHSLVDGLMRIKNRCHQKEGDVLRLQYLKTYKDKRVCIYLGGVTVKNYLSCEDKQILRRTQFYFCFFHEYENCYKFQSVKS